MRDFARISPTFWAGHTGRELRGKGPLAQLVALYLLTSPHHNYIGMYRLPTAYIADDLQLGADQVMKALADIESTGFAKYDKATSVVWVIEAARWQVVECREALKAGDKKCKGVQREFDELPTDCSFLDEFYAKYATVCHMRARNCTKAATEQVQHTLPVDAREIPRASRTAEQAEVDQLAKAASEYRYIRPLTTLEALQIFQEWRDRVGVPNPAVEKRIAQDVLALAQSDGDNVANRALFDARLSDDPDCVDWARYAREACELYADPETDVASVTKIVTIRLLRSDLADEEI